MKQKTLLGYSDNEPMSLSSPKWDCDWYVGFGYIGNNNLHTHLDWHLDERIPNENMFDQMKKTFGESLTSYLTEEKDLWKFCELFSSWGTLKEAYEVYNRGGSHYTSVTPNLKDFKTARKILKDLFAIVNEICLMLNMEGLEWTKEIESDLRVNMGVKKVGLLQKLFGFFKRDNNE